MPTKKKRTKILWGRLITLLIAAVAVIALICIGTVKIITGVTSGKGNKPDASSVDASLTSSAASQADYASGAADDSADIEIPWNLKLVNAQNPIEEDYEVPLTNIHSWYAASDSVKLDSRAAEAFENMCAAAAKDHVKIFAASAYRSVESQQALFKKETAKQKSLNPSLTTEQAEEKAATVVTRPGTSEHNLGLAIDINTDEESFKNTPEYAWLKAHAKEYGFIERYPKNKVDITGIIYEPWHYRYVGVSDATRINELDMCLEEYIDYLKSGKK